MTETCFVSGWLIGFSVGAGLGIAAGIGMMIGVIWLAVKLMKLCYAE